MKKILYIILMVLYVYEIQAEKQVNIHFIGSEKPIVIIVPSYNNREWYKKNLDSLFTQNYENFSVIYIDDYSDDGTDKLVQDYIAENGYQDKCTFIRNEKRYGPLYNRYKAIHSCSSDAIIVLVDGDDWLAHENVLAYLNQAYTQEDIYMTVGNACKSSTGKKIGYRDYTQEEWQVTGIRQLGFRGVHPRTFYGWLFKRIKLEDLFEGERLYPMATDIACLLPMFEMAQGHYKYITDILYVYNDENTLNMARQGFHTQMYCDLMIRNKNPYQRLELEALEENQSRVGALSFVSGIGETSYSFVDHCVQNGVSFQELVVIGSKEYPSDIFTSLTTSLKILPLGCDLQSIYSLRINIKDRLKLLVQEMKADYIAIFSQEFLNTKGVDFDYLCTVLNNTQAHAMVIGQDPAAVVDSYYIYSQDHKNTIVMARPWMLLPSFNSSQGCLGLIINKKTLLSVLDAMTVCYPNFHTFLAAWNSLIPMESVLLINFLK